MTSVRTESTSVTVCIIGALIGGNSFCRTISRRCTYACSSLHLDSVVDRIILDTDSSLSWMLVWRVYHYRPPILDNDLLSSALSTWLPYKCLDGSNSSAIQYRVML